MSDEDWDAGFGKAIAVYLNGDGINDCDARGQPVTDDSFMLCFNAHHEPIEFRLPPEPFGPAWTPIIDTDAWPPANGDEPLKFGTAVKVGARSLAVFTTGPVDAA